MAGGFCNDIAPNGAGRRVKLWLWERVEDRFGAVAEPLGEFAALGDEPKPVRVRLQNAEAVVIREAEHLNQIAWAYRRRNAHEDRPLGHVGTGTSSAP